MKLNGLEITPEDLKQRQKEVSETKGVKIIEIGPDEFKIKIEG